MDFKSMAQANQILKIRVGSHLFGTNTPESDQDFLGVFMPPDETVFGFQRCDEVDLGIVDKAATGRNTKDAVDFKTHDYRKFIKLIMENNPNFIQAIFVNEQNIIEKDARGFADRLLSVRDRIVHKGAYRKFVAYADSQKHKMKIKPQKYSALEEGLALLEQSFDDNQVMADVVIQGAKIGVANYPFVDHGRGKHVRCGDISIERGVFVKKAKKMIRDRLSKATGRTALYTKFGFDTKFACHLIQLLMMGRELMKTGQLAFPLTYADQVLDVKQGKYSIEEIDEWSEQLLEEARSEYEKTDLPSRAGNWVEKFAMNELREWVLTNYQKIKS